MSENDTPTTPRMPDDNDPMAKLTRLVVSLIDDMQQVREDQKEIKQRLSNLEHGQQEINSRLSTLEQKVDIMDARLKETNKLDKIIGEVSETNHRLGNIEVDIVELRRRAAYDQGKLAEVDSRVQKLEKEHHSQLS
jgi:predicted  nucleic acid-binding Zn-ribbon protein